MAAIHKLTALAVAAAKPKLRKNPTHQHDFVESALNDGGYLYLLVRPDGGKSWSLLYRSPSNGKSVRMGLGSYPIVSLAAARVKAADLREVIARGDDPREARAAAQNARAIAAAREMHTLRAVAQLWRDESKKDRKWSAGHDQRQWGLVKNWILPHIGNDYIGDITPAALAAVIRRPQDQKRREVGHRVRGVLQDIYDYACGSGITQGNPVRQNGNLGRLSASETDHRPAITKPERLGPLLRAMRGYEGRGQIVHAALNLYPLLAQRMTQFVHARWDQFDLDDGMWFVPVRSMKGKAADKAADRPPFPVPLPRQAVEILRELQKFTGCDPSGFVFPSVTKAGRPMSVASIGAALRALGYDTKKEITPHGWRAALLTITQDELELPAEWADRHLGHRPKVEGAASDLGTAYNRSLLEQQRKKLMQAYADYLDEVAETAGPGAPRAIPQAMNVVQLCA